MTAKEIVPIPEAVSLPEAPMDELDTVFTFFYQSPSIAKVDKFFTIANDTNLLMKRQSHSPITAFLAVVFDRYPDAVFGWMGSHHYHGYAQEIIVNALMMAGMRDHAVTFAKAHAWPDRAVDALRTETVDVDLKRYPIRQAGHVDTMWGAFSASGDVVYVERVIDSIFNIEIG